MMPNIVSGFRSSDLVLYELYLNGESFNSQNMLCHLYLNHETLLLMCGVNCF